MKRANKQQEYKCSRRTTSAHPPPTHIHTGACIRSESMLIFMIGKSCILEYKRELNMCVCVYICVCVRAFIFCKKFDFRRIFVFRTRDISKKKPKEKFPIFTSIVILIKILISIHFIPFLEIRFILNVMAVFSPSFVTLNRQRCVHRVLCMCV